MTLNMKLYSCNTYVGNASNLSNIGLSSADEIAKMLLYAFICI